MTLEQAKQTLTAAGYTQNGNKYEKTVKGHHIEFEPSDEGVIVCIDANTDNFIRFLTVSFHPDEIKWVENELTTYIS